MVARPGDVLGGVVRRHGAPARGDLLAVADGAVADVRAAPLDHETGCGEAGRSAALEREDLVRRASTTGTALGAPAASASSVETPATGTPSEMASVRAVTSPMRKPVAPRAGADGNPADVAGLEPGLRQQLLDVLQHAHGPRARSPSTSPSRTSATVATSVAVSNARISTCR